MMPEPLEPTTTRVQQRTVNQKERRLVSFNELARKYRNLSKISIWNNHLDIGVHHSEEYDGVFVDFKKLSYHPESLIITPPTDTQPRAVTLLPDAPTNYRRTHTNSISLGHLQLLSFLKSDNLDHLNQSIANSFPTSADDPLPFTLDPFEVESILESLPDSKPIREIITIANNADSKVDELKKQARNYEILSKSNAFIIKSLNEQVAELTASMAKQKAYYDRELAAARKPRSNVVSQGHALGRKSAVEMLADDVNLLSNSSTKHSIQSGSIFSSNSTITTRVACKPGPSALMPITRVPSKVLKTCEPFPSRGSKAAKEKNKIVKPTITQVLNRVKKKLGMQQKHKCIKLVDSRPYSKRRKWKQGVSGVGHRARQIVKEAPSPAPSIDIMLMEPCDSPLSPAVSYFSPLSPIEPYSPTNPSFDRSVYQFLTFNHNDDL